MSVFKLAALQGIHSAREKVANGDQLVDLIARLKGMGQAAAEHPVTRELMAVPEISATVAAGRNALRDRMVGAVTSALGPKPSFFDQHGGKMIGGAAGLGALGLLYSLANKPERY